jgi:hypothetical protein
MRASRIRSLAVGAAIAVLLAPPFSVRAADDAGALAERLIASADARGLADSRLWHTLLHYERGFVGSKVESLADGARFFFAPDGRTNPRAELAATIRAFADSSARTVDGEIPRCAFPARFRFLAEQLDLDPATMPAASCETYDRWIAGMRPSGATLVFPEAYLNNPASMFGHTLLRIDAEGETAGRDMLAYAVNFAAETGTDGGASFAVKGISGFYPGYFTVLPYYEKLEQYGDWENRDIWEYRLNLTREETLRMLEHVWELRAVSFPYYFFDDNCSYHLLAVLEVARPSLRLTGDFPLWVIPVDTVRTVAEKQGLVADVHWRPSPATRLRHSATLATQQERALARAVSAGELAPDAPELDALAPDRRGFVLTLAYDDLRYRYLDGDVSEEASRPLSLAILRSISRAGPADADSPSPGNEPQTPGARPEEGHPSTRLSIAGGVRNDDGFVELRLRPVFHGLTDPVGGYPPGAEIVIMESALRWVPERDSVRVEEVRVVDITSITPRDDFLTPVSWRFGAGLRTRLLPDDGDLDPENVGRLDGGAGMAWQPHPGVLVFGFGESTLEVGGALEHDVAFAPGASAGVLAGRAENRLRSKLSAHAAWYVLGDTTDVYRVAMIHDWKLSPHFAVELETAWEHGYGEDWLDAKLALKWFFRRNWDGE